MRILEVKQYTSNCQMGNNSHEEEWGEVRSTEENLELRYSAKEAAHVPVCSIHRGQPTTDQTQLSNLTTSTSNSTIYFFLQFLQVN